MICWYYLRFCSEGQFVDTTNLVQGLLKLRGHDEVEKEISRTVDEGHHVHHLPNRVVALKEELLA